MTQAELLEELLTATRQLGIEICWREGNFTGGFCRLKSRPMLFLKLSIPASTKIELICTGLARMDLSTIFLRPAIRERIELSRRKRSA